ncbi:MAG: hypothetical protein HZB46_03915 [Solirubrobacterales bacterium]|nr:hypothetical protein [Solirubrobacterales bacterium]
MLPAANAGAQQEQRIFSAAGSGLAGSTGTGALATLGAINYPRGLTALPDGGFLVTEAYGHRIRRITPDGRILAFAGTGTSGFSGDGGLATKAKLKMPHGTVALPDGSVLIADTNNFRVRRVTPGGIISTVAGTGVRAFLGDGGPATAARISAPRGIGLAPDGGYLIADSDNNRIRRVTPAGTITTIAGTGLAGFSGDGGPATAAALNAPYGVSALPDGTIFIADQGNHRIRRIAPDGTISTVAGVGTPGALGDGGPATAAQLNAPHAVEALPDGRLLIADTANHRVRQVTPDGIITTIAGTGVLGFSGEAGSPLDAALFYPKALLSLGSGVLVADADNNRVRFIGPSPWPTPAIGSGVVFVDGAATYTRSRDVSVGTVADGVTSVRLSNSPAVINGVLSAGATYPAGGPVAWNLADAAAGGTTTEGSRLVYAQWQSPSGTWSPVTMDSIVLDTVAPTTTAPAPTIAAGTNISATAVPVRYDWTGADATSGVAGYDVEVSRDGGAPAIVAVAAATSTQWLTPGAQYVVGARGRDRAGNIGEQTLSEPLRLDLTQESSPAISYEGAWTTSTSSSASGGAIRTTTDVAGAATFSFTGRTLAWVVQMGTANGTATIDLDGVAVTTVNLRASSTISRRMVYVARWPSEGPHTIKVKNVTAGKRMTLDAFVVGS